MSIIRTADGWRQLGATLVLTHAPGVFRPQEVTSERTDRFCARMAEGDLKFNEPLFGAFGESIDVK